MVSAYVGVVTALIGEDQQAANQQLVAIVKEHAAAAGGDHATFAFRMLKQLEAGARHNVVVIRTLSKRAGLNEEEVHQILAQLWLDPGLLEG